MNMHPIIRNGAVGTAIAAALALGLTTSPMTPAYAAMHGARAPAAPGQSSVAVAPAPVNAPIISLSTSQGKLITLPAAMTDLFIADEKVADVQVRSPTKLYVFGKAPGETTLSATNKAGQVVFTTTIRVGNNIESIGQMLKLTMPDAQITATPMNGIIVLTGTVAAPDDVEEANRLVSGFVGQAFQVVSRLKTATPLQVMLKVRFSEISRNYAKNIGFNFTTNDNTGGFKFGLGQGSGVDLSTGKFTIPSSGTALAFGGPLAGLSVLSALDLAETQGFGSTLAEPTLTALSGETASFLAGGEIPIPVPQYQGVTTIDYKQYGISLAFTPTVLGDGRISMRVKPEVSQLDAGNGVSIGGTAIPAISTRRAETTVELGSGQSFVIGGLLNNNTSNTVNKAPFLADLPVLGQLFRSNGWKRQEDELVIVVTPYLVRPVSHDSQVALPTDGYRQSTDLQNIFLDRQTDGKTGGKRHAPTATPPVTAPAPGAPVAVMTPDTRRKAKPTDAAPGIAYN